jgi:hypothetical protein
MEIMRRHASLLIDWFGERKGIISFRKHAGWYTKGFPGGTRVRQAMVRISALDQLDDALAPGDPDQPFPAEAMRMKRGKRSGTQRVALPEGYLDDLEDATPPSADAETADSGG